MWPNARIQLQGRRTGAVDAAGAVRGLVSRDTLLGRRSPTAAYDAVRLGT